MGDKSQIEWTDATWNPATGCTKVSPGCAHCYIERTPPFRVNHRRFDAKGAIPIQLHPERLTQPLRWERPRRVFVNSLSDLFHEDIPNEFIDQVFAAMALTPQHTYQILTKRPQRMQQYISDTSTRGIGLGHDVVTRIAEYANVAPAEIRKRWPLPNVWLGVTAENQRFAHERTAVLREVPAAVHFISYEPALELVAFDLRGIDWLICGGESGPGARPMHPEWARSARDQCVAAGVPFFFKQWGEWIPCWQRTADMDTRSCAAHYDGQTGLDVYRVGKKAAGRLLDGREWNEYPKGA